MRFEYQIFMSTFVLLVICLRIFFFTLPQELCSKESEFKTILFSLCYFHACVCERRKFGPQGWNISYPFSIGDLTISVYVLFNYLEGNRNIPWDDLRYLFGEIMYGGHIVGKHECIINGLAYSVFQYFVFLEFLYYICLKILNNAFSMV